jgi:hypothetical protein
VTSATQAPSRMVPSALIVGDHTSMPSKQATRPRRPAVRARPGPAPGRRTRRRTRPPDRTSRNRRWHRPNQIGSARKGCPGRRGAAGSSPGSTPTLR